MQITSKVQKKSKKTQFDISIRGQMRMTHQYPIPLTIEDKCQFKSGRVNAATIITHSFCRGSESGLQLHQITPLLWSSIPFRSCFRVLCSCTKLHRYFDLLFLFVHAAGAAVQRSVVQVNASTT